eukprot:PhF_6_TR39661/c2_g1_i1/m.58863
MGWMQPWNNRDHRKQRQWNPHPFPSDDISHVRNTSKKNHVCVRVPTKSRTSHFHRIRGNRAIRNVQLCGSCHHIFRMAVCDPIRRVGHTVLIQDHSWWQRDYGCRNRDTWVRDQPSAVQLPVWTCRGLCKTANLRQL